MMNIFVISNPTYLKNEANIINALFEEGLELFHLRKHDYSEREYKDLLHGIKPQFLPQVVLHQYHYLTKLFGIKRIHFPEHSRRDIAENIWKEKEAEGFVFSTSIHDMETYDSLADSFSYTFYGPVFESISKPGYKPTQEIVLPAKANRKTNLIAIGGITCTKLDQVEAYGFDGAALLGAIWEDPKNALKTFEQCSKNVHTY